MSNDFFDVIDRMSAGFPQAAERAAEETILDQLRTAEAVAHQAATDLGMRVEVFARPLAILKEIASQGEEPPEAMQLIADAVSQWMEATMQPEYEKILE